MLNLIKPKRPGGAGWAQQSAPPQWVSLGYAAEAWIHPEYRLYAISAVEVAKDADGIDRGPEYHLSVSAQSTIGHTMRCTSADALWVLNEFDLVDAEEDNHVLNGLVRNFWRPVADHLVGLECGCKDDEPSMLEDKGDYIWRERKYSSRHWLHSSKRTRWLPGHAAPASPERHHSPFGHHAPAQGCRWPVPETCQAVRGRDRLEGRRRKGLDGGKEHRR